MDNETSEQLPSPVLFKFTNQEVSHDMDNILAMFYHGVYENSIGIMQAFNIETGEQELIIVGVELDEDGKADCYPLAKVFAVEDTARYLAPDGKGGWYDPRNPSEVAEAKENMRTYEKAVVN